MTGEVRMSYFEWKDSFSVGIASIDEEHKQIIGFINRLHTAGADAQNYKEMWNILGGLIEYTMTHFAHEEKLMKDHGYPDLAAHRESHDDLFVKVNEYKTRLKTEKEGIYGEMMEFLKDWLSIHILNTDKKYSDFFKDRGVS